MDKQTHWAQIQEWETKVWGPWAQSTLLFLLWKLDKQNDHEEKNNDYTKTQNDHK